MTERLYYTDSYLREFRARVTGRSEDGSRVILDRTASIPLPAGSQTNRGRSRRAEAGVEDEGDRIAHILASPLGDHVECQVDWERRFDHMQQHSGQHLLSAVFVELFGIATVSFHLGAG